MAKNTKKFGLGKTLMTLAVGSLAIVSASCGGTDSSFSPVGSDGSGLGVPTGPYDFYGFCAQRGGVVNQFPELYCRIERDFATEYYLSVGAAFPILTPDNPEASTANPKLTPFYVHAGDHLTFFADGASKWFVKDCGSFCVYTTGDFFKLDGSDVGYNDGVRSGLVASIDGGQPFLLGYEYDEDLKEEGYFRYGYNVDIDFTVGPNDVLTHSLYVGAFKITHCENTAGITITCP